MSEAATSQESTPPRRTRRRGPASPEGTSPARRQAAAILEVLAGVRRPIEAAQALGTSLPRYYQLERRALEGLVRACEPAPRGPRVDVTRRLAQLERENQRLQRECERQQALVRMAERTLGLASPTVKPPAKGKAVLQGGKRRRPRVRALEVVHNLQATGESDVTSVVATDPAREA